MVRAFTLCQCSRVRGFIRLCFLSGFVQGFGFATRYECHALRVRHGLSECRPSRNTERESHHEPPPPQSTSDTTTTRDGDPFAKCKPKTIYKGVNLKRLTGQNCSYSPFMFLYYLFIILFIFIYSDFIIIILYGFVI